MGKFSAGVFTSELPGGHGGSAGPRKTPHKGLARPTWHTSKRATIGFEPPGTAFFSMDQPLQSEKM